MANANKEYWRYVTRHRRYVRQEGRRLRAGWWQLIRHDLSKFLPDEWFPYADYFYGGPYPEANHGDIRAQFGEMYTQPWIDARFNLAWLKHQRRNPHHWQHWVLRNDDGSTQALEMPGRYVREMVADWAGAGLAIHGRVDVASWYAENKDKLILHKNSRWYVESLIHLFYGGTPPE